MNSFRPLLIFGFRKSKWLLLLLSLLLFPACSATSVVTQPDINESQTGVEIPPGQTSPAQDQVTIHHFPNEPGTVWVYIKTGYSQAEDDSGRLVHGVARIEEHVVDTQNVPPYKIVHIEGQKDMISADDGWIENGIFGLGEYEYWYVEQGDMVYLSYQRPDPAAIRLEELPLAYAFPLRQGAEWCGGAEALRNARNSTPLPDPPCFSSKVVRESGPYIPPVGEIGDCYEIHELFNSGNVITRFCNEIGVVAIHYDHGGTSFGFHQELVEWTRGQDGYNWITQDPTFAPLHLTPTILYSVDSTITPGPSQ